MCTLLFMEVLTLFKMTARSDRSERAALKRRVHVRHYGHAAPTGGEILNLRSLRFGAIGPPLAVAAVCAAALVWFDRIWIPAQQQYLNERNLRSLRTIAAQIKAKVDNFDQALDHTVDSPDAKLDVKSHGADLQKYVKLFSPELEIVATDKGNPAWTKVRKGDPPSVTIRS